MNAGDHVLLQQPYEMRQIIANSMFAPVPLGRGPDSFRLYEALELGAIPIITDTDHFNIPLGNHPLPMYVCPCCWLVDARAWVRVVVCGCMWSCVGAWVRVV